MFIFSLGGESSIWLTCTFTIAVCLRNPVFPQKPKKLKNFEKFSKKKSKEKKNEKNIKTMQK